MAGKHFLSLKDWSREQVEGLFDLAAGMKADPAAWSESLKGQSLAMVFQKPSTRTRVSFEVGMFQLGGQALFLGANLNKKGLTLDLGNAKGLELCRRLIARCDVFVENFLQHIKGRPMTGRFDGHANCFIESGNGKGLLIDFNYDVEPLPGMFPLPGVGPFSLLQESRVNHWGKMMFRWMYWNILLKGKELPIPAQMSMAGKWG